ncbi:uncharacterized protein A4U43_C05F1460 [Asparagus officinalis]|uniref:DUF4378 domain-containing protein n=1 Tax=Asparagus officinalis TaxID=4686 RepID=A0A5P1ENJ6_ASPOF|nr:uncharacterized protein LOC109840293 [Asparagus officinalis]ONK67575.1 uncharacterized protein A4U43_C05F1460 [Asparagus officinalis]
MGADKGGTKSGGFFHLFDWNRKSRKKLFSSGTVSPESTKQEKRSQDNLAASRLRLVDDDDEVVGVSSVKGSSDYSCASSITDEEGFALRAPGVVARLMGLDSMPTSGASEPSSTPFFDTRSLRDKQSHKTSPEFYVNDRFNHVVHRADGYARRPMELRAQKMPSSPIERFQTETLPPRSAKSLPLTHHKLLSPIKNPGFISARNATHIMEAAAKILDPGNQPSTRTKVSSFAPSSVPLRFRDSKDNMVVPQSQRTLRILESARTPVDSTDFRYLRGQPLNKSWNGSEDSTALRRSPDVREPNLADVKGKGKSISLAIQAKVNVQRREGLSSSSRNSLDQKEHECSFNPPFKSQQNNQKNKQQKKPLSTNASGVLRQNNQKQNCMSNKGKLSSKHSMYNQHGRKVSAGDSSSTKNKTFNKFSGNSRVGQRKECVETMDFEREGSSSSNKDFPRKKRLIERGFISEKNGFVDNVLVERHQKRVQSNVVIDERSSSRWKADNRSDGADVVSFTFTSPLIKPVSGSRFSNQAVENLDNGNMYCFDTHKQMKDEDENDKKLTSHGLNVISGDALSFLLEQKLRELTSGMEPSSSSTLKERSFTASSDSQESVSDLTSDTSTVENQKEFQQNSCSYKPGSIFGYGVSSINGQEYGVSTLKGEEECSSSSDARKELDQENLSPFSVLEASFSNESYNLTESLDGTNGGKTCLSSIQAQNNMSFISVAETELSDSASSTLTENSDASEINNASHTKSSNHELDYIKEIVFNSATTSKVLAGEKLNPLLFDKLEAKRRVEDKDGRLRRKTLFDCVDECLDLKCSRYFRTGYKSWSKGAAVVNEENLAKEIYAEISGWNSMGDWMADEVVDKDMSSHLGKWVDYEIEAFEAGAEIEKEIVNSLVDEVIADCLMKAAPSCS